MMGKKPATINVHQIQIMATTMHAVKKGLLNMYLDAYIGRGHRTQWPRNVAMLQ